MQGWRARTFHLTRNKVFLAKCVAGILGAGVVLSLAIHAFVNVDKPKVEVELMAPGFLAPQVQFLESAQRLQNAATPDPASLADWARDVAGIIRNRKVQVSFDSDQLRLGSFDLHPLISKHAEPASQEVFAAFFRCLFMEGSPDRAAARTELAHIAATSPAPAFANEFEGDILSIENKHGKALAAYLKESPTPKATHSRELALHLAIQMKDLNAMRTLCADARVLDEASPIHLFESARLTGSRAILFQAIMGAEKQRWFELRPLMLALIAFVVWYVLLVHSASPEKGRYIRYLLPAFAGVGSVWLLHWWHHTLNYPGDPEKQQTMAQEALHWILYVGIPEELAKLVLFLPFIPWLLYKRSGVKAALTAGCVGLGFALNENLGYLQDGGFDVAIVRLLTANFMHISLSGILGWYTWDLFRSRFHHVTEFITAFIGVSVAHGLYDFAVGARSAELGTNMASIIILALGARYYLKMLNPGDRIRHRMTASSTFVFLAGAAFLTGLMMVFSVYQQQSLMGITLVLKSALGLVPVALIYVKEFNDV